MKIVKYDATKISPTVPASSQYSIGAAVGGSSSNDDNQDDYKPMFARFILDPIWHIYKLAMHQQDVKAAAIYAQIDEMYHSANSTSVVRICCIMNICFLHH